MEEEQREYFGVKEVAEFCEVQPTALAYHQNAGHLVAAFRAGRRPIFLRAHVEEFRDLHYAKNGLTKREISARFGVSCSLVEYYQDRGQISPVAKRGRSNVYAVKDVERVFFNLGNL